VCFVARQPRTSPARTPSALRQLNGFGPQKKEEKRIKKNKKEEEI
jgi:hypothetical protein